LKLGTQRLTVSSSQSEMDAEGITRFGVTGLIVPATSVLSPASNLARANVFASCSPAKVSVPRCADAVGLVHALLLRIQALLLPIKTLVLSGH
jgi:hypothetical protein